MPKDNNGVASMADFKFDENADWDFGTTIVDKTNTSKVVGAVKSGTTIDEVEDDDDDETTTNLEDAKDDEPEEEEIEVKKIAPKKEVAVKKAPIKKVANDEGKNEEEAEEENEEDEDISFEDEDGKGAKNKKKDAVKKDEVVEDEDDGEFFNDLAIEMKEKGIFEHVELPKGKKLTEEEFVELYDEEAEARAGAIVEEWAKNMDDEGKEFIKHKQRGGSSRDFIEAYSGSGIDYENFDADDEAQQLAVIRFYVTNYENLDSPEDIEDRIETIKDKGQAKAKAETWVAKLQKIDEKKKVDFKKEQDRIENDRKENARKFNEGLIDTLNKIDAVGSFPINKVDQKELAPYMTKGTIKSGKGYVPALHAELARILKAETVEDKKEFILLSKLIKNKFDVSDLIPKAETKVVKRANSILQHRRTSGVKVNSAGSYGSKALADAFSD